ncbi:hypothetical protein ACFL35_17615 [Candidatus Riflebacteria bacterium]
MLKINFQIQKGRNLFFNVDGKESIFITRLDADEEVPYLWATGHGLLLAVTTKRLFLSRMEKNSRAVHWLLERFGLGYQQLKALYIVSSEKFFLIPEIYYVNEHDLNEYSYQEILQGFQSDKMYFVKFNPLVLQYSRDELTYKEKFRWIDRDEASEEFEQAIDGNQYLVGMLGRGAGCNFKISSGSTNLKLLVTRMQVGITNLDYKDVLRLRQNILKTAQTYAKKQVKVEIKCSYLKWAFEAFLVTDPVFLLLDIFRESFFPGDCVNVQEIIANWIADNWEFMHENKGQLLFFADGLLKGRKPVPGAPEELGEHYRSCAVNLLEKILQWPQNLLSCIDIFVNRRNAVSEGRANFHEHLNEILYKRIFEFEYKELVFLDRDCELYTRVKRFLDDNRLAEKRGERQRVKGLLKRMEFYERVIKFRLGDLSLLPGILRELEKKKLEQFHLELYNDLSAHLGKEEVLGNVQKNVEKLSGLAFYSNATCIMDDNVPFKNFQVISEHNVDGREHDFWIYNNQVCDYSFIFFYQNERNIEEQMNAIIDVLRKNAVKHLNKTRDRAGERNFAAECHLLKATRNREIFNFCFLDLPENSKIRKEIFTTCVIFKARLVPFYPPSDMLKNQAAALSVGILDL